MLKIKVLVAFMSLAISIPTFSATQKGRYFERAIFVLFENTDYAVTMKQPFFKQLASSGANFSNLLALAHPSQPNYIALTSGSLHGVKSNNNVNLDVRNIADLLDAKGISWKVYAEDFPGNCFTGTESKGYARKHNPFISYLNIQKNPARCTNIVGADQFDKDIASNSLPSYVFYVPNNKNSGHDTGVAYADKWYGQKFSKFVKDPQFMKDTVLISTFDESGSAGKNQIYASIVGASVKPGTYSTGLTLYSLMNLIEDNWDLGNLDLQDAAAVPIPNIWQ